MRILYFIDHLRPDGSQHVLRKLAEGLATRGHSQTVVCLNDSWDQPLVDALNVAGVEVKIVGRQQLLSGIGLVSLLRWMKKQRFDAVMTILFYSDVIGRTLAKLAGIPHIVASLQARNVHYTSWQRFLVRATMRWADAILIPSPDLRDFAVAVEGATPGRIEVVPYSVAVEDYLDPMTRSELRAELGLPVSHILIGTAGRLTHQKGVDILIAAMAMIPRPDLHLLLAGVGPDETTLREQVSSRGLTSRVHFVGYRRDLPRVLPALDLYVHPARWEGMPIVLLSAMAANCPIVATAVDGNRALIDDGVHGWLVPPESAEALALAMQDALANLPEAQRRATAAYQRVQNNFSVDRMVTAVEAVLAAGGTSDTTR